MRSIIIGIVIGMVFATFVPEAADRARDVFDGARNLTGGLVERVGEMASAE